MMRKAKDKKTNKRLNLTKQTIKANKSKNRVSSNVSRKMSQRKMK